MVVRCGWDFSGGDVVGRGKTYSYVEDSVANDAVANDSVANDESVVNDSVVQKGKKSYSVWV